MVIVLSFEKLISGERERLKLIIILHFTKKKRICKNRCWRSCWDWDCERILFVVIWIWILFCKQRKVRKRKWKWKSLNRVQLFVAPCTIAHHPPRSMEFSRLEYWSGFPFPSPGDLPNPGLKPRSPALQADYLPSESPRKLRKSEETFKHLRDRFR